MISVYLQLDLVIEIPTYTEAEYALVQRVVRGEKIIARTATSIYVAHHHKEACLLQMEVGIDVNDRIFAHLRFVIASLHSILS